MKILNYLFEIKEKINKINLYISNPLNYEKINNPFNTIVPKTFIWLEDNNN